MLDLEVNKTIKTIASVGRLEYTDKEKRKVKWFNSDPKDRTKPIFTWDVKGHDERLGGHLVVIEHPPDDVPNPRWSRSMYKIVYDPVNDDFGGTSLAAILVYKSSSVGDWNAGLKNTLVASYHGRLESVDEIHDICVKLALYYNAKILPETNLPDFVRYCKLRGLSSLLQVTPYDAISTLINGKRSNKYDVGMRMMKAEKLQGEQLIRQYLLEERGIDPVTNKKILNLHHIYDLKLLDELVNYTRDNNTDAVSAFKLLMFWLYQEEMVPIAKKDVVSEAKKKFNDHFAKISSTPKNYTLSKTW